MWVLGSECFWDKLFLSMGRLKRHGGEASSSGRFMEIVKRLEGRSWSVETDLETNDIKSSYCDIQRRKFFKWSRLAS